MAKRPAFILPEGLKLEIGDDRIAIEYDGDVEIEVDLGRSIAGIQASGDVTVKLPSVTGDLVSGGVLRLMGDFDGGVLHGREIVLGRQSIRCRAISADERIVIGAANISCDVIIAPEINLDPKAQGRVTVIESLNERGATKIKGGFSLSDYEDMFGNSREFLAERGLAPLGTPKPKEEEPAHRTGTPVGARQRHAEDTEDPLSLSLDDLEPLVDPAATPATADDKDVLQQRLSDALGRITACYEGSDLPPAVEELRELVEHRDYDGLRTSITDVWNGLLGFHQKRGIRPHHQVTHAFNVIHGLVQG
ncbi:MAG: DUF4230 domain-containing protein [Myxococcota bacterium]